MKTAPLLSGLDVLLEDPAPLRGRRLGLVANPASVTSGFVPTARALVGAGLDVRVLFGPEHGLTGAVQDMLAVGDGDTPSGRVPVVSLYGERFEDLSPRPEHLAGLDAVVCDLPDVGSRYYTFVWTTALVMKACAAQGIPVFVLDRPNPLGGLVGRGEPPRGTAPLVRRPLARPAAARDDAGRDRALRERRVRVRLRPDRRPDEGRGRARPRSARADRRDAGVGPPVAEHAVARDGARLPRHVPPRGDEPLRGARHDAPVRDRRRAVARRGASPRTARTPSASRASPSGRTSSARRSTSSRGRTAAASSCTSRTRRRSARTRRACAS